MAKLIDTPQTTRLGVPLSRTTTNRGTKKIRRMVRLFGRFMTRSAVVSHVILQYSERRGILTIDPDWAPVNAAYRAAAISESDQSGVEVRAYLALFLIGWGRCRDRAHFRTRVPRGISGCKRR